MSDETAETPRIRRRRIAGVSACALGVLLAGAWLGKDYAQKRHALHVIAHDADPADKIACYESLLAGSGDGLSQSEVAAILPLDARNRPRIKIFFGGYAVVSAVDHANSLALFLLLKKDGKDGSWVVLDETSKYLG